MEVRHQPLEGPRASPTIDMRNRLPLIAALVIALSLGLHLFRDDSSSTSSTLQPSPDSGHEESQATTGELPAAGTREPDDEGVEDADVPQSPALETEEEDTRPATDALDLAWQERYGELDVDGLRAVLAPLEGRFQSERELALDDQFTLGRYRAVSAGDAPLELATAPDGSPLISETRTATDPETLAIEARTVTLAVDEHGALYELLAEIGWLKARIGE